MVPGNKVLEGNNPLSSNHCHRMQYYDVICGVLDIFKTIEYTLSDIEVPFPKNIYL